MTATSLRSHRCGDLRREHAGTVVRLGGWVHRSRDLGGLLFIDLRDRSGIVQLSFNPDWTPADVLRGAAQAGTESVVLVEGVVELRPETARDSQLATRDVEIHVTACRIVGPAVTPAISVARKEGEELAAEDSGSSIGCWIFAGPSSRRT